MLNTFNLMRACSLVSAAIAAVFFLWGGQERIAEAVLAIAVGFLAAAGLVP